jgi:hypothetical protein
MDVVGSSMDVFVHSPVNLSMYNVDSSGELKRI